MWSKIGGMVGWKPFEARAFPRAHPGTGRPDLKCTLMPPTSVQLTQGPGWILGQDGVSEWYDREEGCQPNYYVIQDWGSFPRVSLRQTAPSGHKRGTSAIAFGATGLAASSPVGRDTRLLTAILCGLDRCGRCHVARDERVSVCCVGLQGFNC